jgi:hypothetical protein
MFDYSSRREKTIFPKLGMLRPWDEEEILEGSNSKKVFWIRVPVKGGFCSSETKNDRRTAK